MPKYSIIVPVYNVEKFLESCIESVVQQSYEDWELILVDDGAKDRSPEICDEYAARDPRIRVIHKTNEGVSIARKTGCERALGSHVLFVDGDDRLEPACLETADRLLREHPVDILKFGCIREDETGKTKLEPPRYKGRFTRERMEKEIFPCLIHSENARYYSPSVWGNVFSKETVLPYMIADRRAVVAQDSACVIPAVYHAGSMYFSDQCMYCYRYNTSSTTKGKKMYPWENPLAIAEHLCKTVDMDRYDFRQQLYRRVAHDVFNVCVSRFYGKKSFRETSAEIRQELKRELYDKAIKTAVFKGSKKALFMMIALKYRLTGLMYLYAKMK